MKILNVNVFSEDVIPFRISVAETFVGSTLDLKFIFFKVNLSVNRNSLCFVPNNINMFSNLMKTWQFSSFAPLERLNIEMIALLDLITTEEENSAASAEFFLWCEARSQELLRRTWCLIKFDFTSSYINY